MNTDTHTHRCPYCRERVECEAAERGGCVCLPSDDVSCGPCVEARFGPPPEAAL